MIGGFFAMLPDAHWVLPEPLKSEWHHGFHDPQWANICFFHHYFDHSVFDTKPTYAFPFMVSAVAVSLALLTVEKKNV